MKRLKNLQSLLAGVVIGGVLFGGGAAYAAGTLAHSASNQIYVNAQKVNVEAYIINGRNYIQLYDLAAVTGLKVVWDEDNRRVMIDTAGREAHESLPAAASATVSAAAPVSASVAAPIPAGDISPAVQQGQMPGSEMTIEEMKAEVVRLTNIERGKSGLHELKVSPELMDCAQAKADDMGNSQYYGHTSPVYGTIGEMIRSYVPEAWTVGENIAPWTKTPQEAFNGWVQSSGHYKNMTDKSYTHIGVGILKGAGGGYWWVQQFAEIQQ